MTRTKRVTRLVYGLYVAVVAAFVVSNIAQVRRQIFEASERGEETVLHTVAPACASQLKLALLTIERARSEASAAPDGPTAKERYASVRASAVPAALEQTCSDSPNGAEALAAFARLDRAAFTHALRTASELRPVRLSTQSFISGQPQ